MKKLLSILSIISFGSILSFDVISCKNINNSKLTLQEQKNSIISAINQKNNNEKLKKINNSLKMSDILDWGIINYKIIDNYDYNFNYDINLNQNSKTFLNKYLNQKEYRIIEIKGHFDIEIRKNKIINNIYNLNYLPEVLNNKLNTQGTLIGTGENCVLYMQSDNFQMFLNSHNPLQYLKNLNIENKFVTLTNKDWSKIIKKISYVVSKDGKAVILIITNGELLYTNMIRDHYDDLPVVNLGYFISSFIFIDSNINTDNYIINKNILYELNDIYTSYKNKESYGKNQWNPNDINKIFINSNYILNHKNMNPKNLSFATSLYYLFNNHYNDNISKLINYYQYHKDDGIYLSFDSNNYQLKNMLYNNDELI